MIFTIRYLASIDWMLQEPSGTASDYITTTIRFLEDTFRAFTHLPVSFRDDHLLKKTVFLCSKNYFLILEKSK
jgi:hypothetical protein